MAYPPLRKSLVASALLAAADLAGAQTAAPNADAVESLQAVTVTAQKRAQPLSDVPLSMQSFTGDSLQKSGVAELSDLIRFIPGASQGISNSIGFQTYQIRATPSISGDNTVAYYFDDVAFSLLGSNIAPVGRAYDIDRIEVLRGPQGTLYGLSALGGAVRFISANPDLDQFRAKGQAGVSWTQGGAPSNYEDAAFSLPIVQGQLAVRFTVDAERKGGYVEVADFPDYKNLDDARIRNYRGKILWQPSDALRVTFIAQHNQVKQDFGTLLISADPPVGTQGTNTGLGSVYTRYDLYALTSSLDVGFASLESSFGYLDYKLDQTAFLNIGGPAKALQKSDQPSPVAELRLVSHEGSSPVDWIVGGFYKHAKEDAGLTLSGAFNLDSSSIQKSSAYAGFSEVSSKLFDGRLVPLVGLRYSVDERESVTPGVNQYAKYHAITPRFNLSYFVDRNTMIYTNLARGVRSGEFNNPALVPIAQSFGIPASEVVRPDKLWSYEVGIKGDLPGGKFGYTVAVYHSVWKDVQVAVAPLPGLGTAVNAGHARGTGIDYSLTWEAIKGVTLAFSGNYNNTKLHDLPTAIADASLTDGFYNGARLPYVPRYSDTISATVDQPFYDAWRLVGFSAFSVIGNQFMPTSAATTDTERLLSARVGVRRKNLEFLLFTDNLLNSKAATYRDLGYVNRIYPRVVGVQASASY